MSNELDRIISRIQSIQSFNIYKILDTGEVEPWYEVVGASIVPELVIREHTVLEEAQTVAGQIMHWGRMVAQCKRVWEIEERNYRIWRDGRFVVLSTPPEGEKKPSEKLIDATIRTDPDYRQWYVRQERAEEAYNAAMLVLNGWRAKKDMLETSMIQRLENSR